jgi:hypothetical protein
MAIGTGTALLASALIGAGTAAYSGRQQRKAQESAAAASEKIASDQAAQAERMAADAEKKARERSVSGAQVQTMAANNRAPSMANSTLLTGPQGVDSSRLTLGRPTLLGG